MNARRVVAATGLAVEAAIAGASGASCVASAGNAERLAAMLDEALSRGARAIMSFGIAGALVDGLRPGTLLIGRAVVTTGECILPNAEWRAALVQRLPRAHVVDIAGSDTIAATPGVKRSLRARTGASAVDTESHVVARLALARGVPFAVFRLVSDPVYRSLPDAALVGLDAHGKANIRAMWRALSGAPAQTLPLAR